MRRRHFLSLAPGLAAGSVGISLLPASAETSKSGQFTAVQRYSLGDWTVIALGDGYLPLDPSVLIGTDTQAVQALFAEAHIDPNRSYAATNAYLVDTGSDLILIDTGSGSAFGPTLGEFARNLKAAGYAPEAVTHILATHLHPDHIGGCALADGNPFPNAVLTVSEVDRAFFQDPAMRAGAPEPFRVFFDLANSVLDSFGDRVSFFEGEATVAPGITAVPLPGHTPGHCGFMLESNGESLLIWGDVLHVPAVQFAHPDIGLVFDTDLAQAAATRAKTLDWVAKDGQLVAGMHLLFPGFGYVEAASQGYHFAAAPWEYF